MFKHILRYLPGKLLPAAINFILIILYSRVLSVEEYGEYALLLAASTFISTVGYIWIIMYVERYFQLYKKNNELLYIFESVKTNYILVSFFLIISVTILNQFLNIKFVGLLICLTLITPVFEITLSIFKANLNSKGYMILSLMKSIIIMCSAVILVYYLNLGVAGIFISLILGNSIFICVLVIKRHNINFVFSKKSLTLNKEFLKYGTPFIITFLLSYVMTMSDRFFIGYYLDSNAVGAYSISYDLTAQTLTMLFMIINLAAYPMIIEAIEQKSSVKQINERIIQYANLALGVLIPTTVVFIILADEIAYLIIGEKFGGDVSLIIRLTAIATFILGLKAYFSDFAFQLGKRTDKQIYPLLVACILNILLNILFIPIWGVVGALISTLISFFVALVGSIYLGRKIYKLNIDVKELLKIIFISSIMAVVVYNSHLDITWINFTFKVVFCIVIYLVLALVFNVLGLKIILRNFKNKKGNKL